MSPGSDTVNITKLYRLKEDGSNWAVYRDRTTDYLKSKGLRSHLNGRVTKPIEVVEKWDESLSRTIFYKPDDTKFENPIALSDVAKYEESASEYDRLEGIGSDVLNNTIPTSIYREIHHFSTLAKKWKALQAMFEHRGNVVQIDILTKLQSARYTSGSMRSFLSQLTEWRNDLSTTTILSLILSSSLTSHLRFHLSPTIACSFPPSRALPRLQARRSPRRYSKSD
jgi:hypothetical protein